MLLKITLDPSLDEEGYKICQISSQEIYAEVTSVNLGKDFDEYHMKQCPVLTDFFAGLPFLGKLTVYPNSALLYCEGQHFEKYGIAHIEFKVQVEECDRFPRLRNGGQS
jgi:hypothetical protein